MSINYNDKTFISIQNAVNGEVNSETVFHYKQQDQMVWAEYAGGGIVKGHLLGKVDHNGKIEMSYHHINQQGELMTGVCTSIPERLDDGRIRLHETWQWTCKDYSKGESIIEQRDMN